MPPLIYLAVALNQVFNFYSAKLILETNYYKFRSIMIKAYIYTRLSGSVVPVIDLPVVLLDPRDLLALQFKFCSSSSAFGASVQTPNFQFLDSFVI
ncbi:unnamed protein product [Citrullus colocynthis]|uniref:Uncharacterized protein n=1 Tax=Citrullus colocynthis TaxID=252529 RepID=A0ABP0Y8Y7_9ROSI